MAAPQRRGGTYAQIMGPERAFGSGVIVDTMEVAGLWSAVPRLYDGIRTALAAHAQAVGCHLSHLYPSGSSLYFTFLISGADDHDAEAQVPRGLAAGRAKLRRRGRNHHPPSRRRPAEGPFLPPTSARPESTC